MKKPRSKLESSSFSFSSNEEDYMFIRESKHDFEHFGLGLITRLIIFITFLISSIILLIFSLHFIIFPVSSLKRFLIPYLLSVITFFLSFGLFGFKSYFKSLFSTKKRYYTLLFIFSVVVQIYLFTHYFNSAILCISILMHICSSVIFSIVFIPGGAKGINTLLKFFVFSK